MRRDPGLHYPRAEHAGLLHLGSIELHCYVLDDGRRVFTQQGMLNALGIAFGGSGQQGRSRLSNFIAQKAFTARAPSGVSGCVKMLGNGRFENVGDKG
jgi:hypothetical protein